MAYVVMALYSYVMAYIFWREGSPSFSCLVGTFQSSSRGNILVIGAYNQGVRCQDSSLDPGSAVGRAVSLGYTFMTNLVMAYVVMAYIVVAYAVMALYSYGPV